jgi:plastocyanin
MIRALPSAAALAVVAILALAGCGSSDKSSGSSSGSSGSSSSAGGAGGLKISADPGGALKFDKTSLSAKAGKVTITMDNPSSLPHAIAVEGNGVDKDGETVMKGGVSTVSVDLKAGSYEFYCPVDGHKAAGMKGTLTVK